MACGEPEARASAVERNFKRVSCMISSAKALFPTIRKLILNNFREYVWYIFMDYSLVIS